MTSARSLLVVLVAIVVLAMASCSGSDGAGDTAADDTSQAAPQESATPADDGPVEPDTFTSVLDLRDAAIAAGYRCPNWQPNNGPEHASEAGSCSKADVFLVFDNDDDLAAQMDTYRDFNKILRRVDLKPDDTLVGPNWMVNGSEAARALQDDLGGELLSDIPDPPTDFERVYRDCHLRKKKGADLGDSGSTLILDMRGDDEAAGLRIASVSCALYGLEVSDAIIARMESTTSLQGVQRGSWGDGIHARWTYHPDNGLDIILTQKA